MVKIRPSNLSEITYRCFGSEAKRLLKNGAIHPINDRKDRKACFVKNHHLGFHDLETSDFLALGFQAGKLSGISVLDLDTDQYVLDLPEPNVLTARGKHYYFPSESGANQVGVVPGVDVLNNSNVVLWDPECKSFQHPRLITDVSLQGVVELLRRQVSKE